MLERYAAITGNPQRTQSLHGTIGGKNNVYVDSVRTQFSHFEDFLAQWLNGLRNDALRKERWSRKTYGQIYRDSSAHRIIRLLKDSLLHEYTMLFLERNFYRNYVERTRAKPESTLWQLWFGDKKLTWGLFIAPAFRNEEWTNDKSEMRRARYHYWTIGHVLLTGLLDPDREEPYTFADLEDLLSFYRSILKRVSNSLYERGIADRYIAYIEESPEPLEEPFLIPELRYAGLSGDHRYRLDYTVLNAHAMSYTGFELSPHSTHYVLTGIRKKKQVDINRELAERWAREMDKRNAYFAKYGITTVTFTDPELADLDACFEEIADFLSERPDIRPNLDDELLEISQFQV